MPSSAGHVVGCWEITFGWTDGQMNGLLVNLIHHSTKLVLWVLLKNICFLLTSTQDFFLIILILAFQLFEIQINECFSE